MNDNKNKIRFENNKKEKKRCQSYGISSCTGENLTPILDIIDLVER